MVSSASSWTWTRSVPLGILQVSTSLTTPSPAAHIEYAAILARAVPTAQRFFSAAAAHSDLATASWLQEDSSYNRIKTLVNEELKQYFRPEFLNRLVCSQPHI